MAQEGPSSERACDRCRERRVKCDKRQPACLRCEKLGKPCPGYDKKRKFVDEGATLRKKYQAAPSRIESKPSPPPTTSWSGRFRAAGKQGSSLDYVLQDAHASSSVVSRDAIHAPSSDIELLVDTTHAVFHKGAKNQDLTLDSDEIILDILNDPSFDPAWFDLDPAEFYSESAASCGYIPGIPNIVDEVDRRNVVQSTESDIETSIKPGLGFHSDDTLWSPEVQLHTSALITDEREHEMAYLIRHFTEAIGPWMDLFDHDKHFGNLVPLKALKDALLRNAIAAVSAKQLGRAKGTKPYIGLQSQKPSTMEVIEDVDWFYKAANYYDKAIAFSRIYLQAISGSLSDPPSHHTHLNLSTANSDDLLVAVSIFSLYEALDNFEIGWLQHLSGLKTLLDAVETDQHTKMQVVPTITIGRKASFWNFARADYQAAYMNRQNTFLDTEDLQLWQSCGLQIQPDGSLYENAAKVKSDPLHCREIAELVAHTLLWLVCRIMNYLAECEDAADITYEIRREGWDKLNGQLDEWHSSLPQTFQPCAQIKYPLQSRTSTTHLTEVFFSMNVCAASLQLYYCARILLLLNKADEATVVGSGGSRTLARLHLYRGISDEAIRHAHQIIGIALGRPHPSVRVEMLLPLYVAGSCLAVEEERRVVLELLRAIEKDTGCSTESRCLNLIKEWGWEVVDMQML